MISRIPYHAPATFTGCKPLCEEISEPVTDVLGVVSPALSPNIRKRIMLQWLFHSRGSNRDRRAWLALLSRGSSKPGPRPFSLNPEPQAQPVHVAPIWQPRRDSGRRSNRSQSDRRRSIFGCSLRKDSSPVAFKYVDSEHDVCA